MRGYVGAYDAETGEHAWRFYTVPGDPSQPFEHPEMATAAGTWTGEWWRVGGGGTVWDSMAYDPDLNLLYVGVGNGALGPEFIGARAVVTISISPRFWRYGQKRVNSFGIIKPPRVITGTTPLYSTSCSPISKLMGPRGRC